MTTRPYALHVGAAAAALVLVSMLVAQASRAAFTASDEVTATFAAGTISLDASTTVAFDGAGNLAPGGSVTGCVVVAYTGSLDASKVTVSSSASGGLAGALTVSVSSGADCESATSAVGSGALDGFSADADWAPTSAETRAFAVTVTLDAAADNSLQGEDSSATFTWTAES